MALPNGHIGRVIGKRGYVGTNGYPRWPGGSKQRREARPTILAGGAAAGSSRELLRAVGPHVEGRLSDQADRVHEIKPRQSVSASSGQTMPDRGRVHLDLGNRQATFYPEVASDIGCRGSLALLGAGHQREADDGQDRDRGNHDDQFQEERPGYFDRRGELFTGGGNRADDDADR